MNIAKILLAVIVLVSIVSAFVGIPYLGALAAIVGVVYGAISVTEDRRIYVLMVALVLASSAGALGDIPAIGDYLTAILTTLGSFAAAAAIGIIGKVTSERLM
jgi:hypothetical protein